jgi:hypothetical protein
MPESMSFNENKLWNEDNVSVAQLTQPCYLKTSKLAEGYIEDVTSIRENPGTEQVPASKRYKTGSFKRITITSISTQS